jgi:phosphoribosylanthranilate isomerase
MTSTAIKICGIRTHDTLDAAIAARADYVGFNFYPPSPRAVSLDEVALLGARAGDSIRKVGVFVDVDDHTIAEAVAAGGLDIVQLHGAETPERVAEVKARIGVEVWKVLPVAAAKDIGMASAYRDIADLILFDAKTPKGALPGGMGLVFDWSLLADYRGAERWGLAGGLNPGNVGDALRITHARLADTSSGVESSPGVKEPALIAAFCEAVRAA